MSHACATVKSRKDSAPDAIEPTTGWRAWDVLQADGTLRLASLESHNVWVPGKPVQAACPTHVSTGHLAPVVGCSCGLHALRDPWAAAGYFARSARPRVPIVHRVIGQVSLWGLVVEGTRGWRARHAYPARIVVPDPGPGAWALLTGFPRSRIPTAELLAGLASYGVPLERVRCSTRAGLATALLRAEQARAGAREPSPQPLAHDG